MNLRIKPKKGPVCKKPAPGTINDGWSMVFMHHHIKDGRSYRSLSVIDDVNRECAGIEVDFFFLADPGYPGTRIDH